MTQKFEYAISILKEKLDSYYVLELQEAIKILEREGEK